MFRCISPGSIDLGTFVAYIPAAPTDGTSGGEDAAGEDDLEPPEPLVEECEVPVAAGVTADSDAASDTSADARPQYDALSTHLHTLHWLL